MVRHNMINNEGDIDRRTYMAESEDQRLAQRLRSREETRGLTRVTELFGGCAAVKEEDEGKVRKDEDGDDDLMMMKKNG